MDSSSVLFVSDDRKIVLVDIPRTIEESQISAVSSTSPDGGEHETRSEKPQVPERRLYSAQPPSTPFVTPDPKGTKPNTSAGGYGSVGPQNKSPAAQIADLMTTAAVSSALDVLRDVYAGPYHLPRLLRPGCDTIVADEKSPQQPQAQITEQMLSPTDEPPYIPEQSHYLHGSIEDLAPRLREQAPEFDLIVLDPPWPNRSARRKTGAGRYATVTNLPDMQHLLCQIPVTSCLRPGGLVALWITNSSSVLDLVTNPSSGILASWGLELMTEWTWIKITASGDPTFDLDSTWRKPWEKLLIAKRVGDQTPAAELVQDRIIVAVPDVHSRKPNLRGLFHDVFRPGYKGLEVFARNLTSGWWSWGDEVLLFQQAHHWASAEPAANE